MKRLKLFPKIFLYTMSIMLFIVMMAHGLIYLLAPRMQLAVSTPNDVVISIRQEQFVTEAVEKALPVSLKRELPMRWKIMSSSGLWMLFLMIQRIGKQ